MLYDQSRDTVLLASFDHTVIVRKRSVRISCVIFRISDMNPSACQAKVRQLGFNDRRQLHSRLADIRIVIGVWIIYVRSVWSGTFIGIIVQADKQIRLFIDRYLCTLCQR